MEKDLSDFEQNMRSEINAFLSPDRKGAGQPGAPKVEPAESPRSARPSPGAERTGHRVRLAVRTKPLEMDHVFEHVSTSISRIEAQLEAERAAKAAGYPIIGHVIETRRL